MGKLDFKDDYFIYLYKGSLLKALYADIISIESDKPYVKFYLKATKFSVIGSLVEVEENLEKWFVEINRKVIVNMKLFASVLLFICFMSCNGRGNGNNTEIAIKKDSISLIKIEEMLKQENTVLNLSNEVDKIDIVPLETTAQSLLTEIEEIEITDSNIFVRDIKDGVFRFSREGLFLNKIGKRSQGPGEYLYVYQMNVYQNKILLSEHYTDSGQQRIQFYNYEGRFLQTIITPKLFVGTRSSFIYFDDRIFATDPIAALLDFRKDYWTLALLDSTYNIEKAFYNSSYSGRETEIWENRALAYGWKNYWEEEMPAIDIYKNEAYISYYQCDTIFKYNNHADLLEPQFILNVGNKPTFEMSHQFIKDPAFFKYIYLHYIYNTKDYFYFACTQSDKTYNIRYHKETGETNVSKKDVKLREMNLLGSPGFVHRSYSKCRLTLKNDLCGGDFYVRFSSSGKYWISVVESASIEKLKNEIRT